MPQRTAIVTGAGSGIGRATTERLAADGHRVLALDLDGEQAERTAETVRGSGGTALAERVFTDQRTARGLGEKIGGIGDEAWGRFDDRSGVLDLRLANLTAELRYGGNGMSRNGATGLGAETIRASLTQAARDVDSTLRK